MNLVDKAGLAAALKVTKQTISNKVKDGSLPAPAAGKFPQTRRGTPRAEDRAMWDLDACLKAWGRPTE